MKKSICLLIAATMLLASCSTKLSLVKRKYNKGFYVSVVKKQGLNKKEEKQQEVVAKRAAAIKTNLDAHTSETLVAAKPEEFNHEAALSNNLPIAGDSQGHEASQRKKNHITASASSAKVLAEHKAIKKLPALSPQKSLLTRLATAKGGDDTNTILLVILCILWWLNLVAVYLHDGRKITTNFWITLILDLTIIGGIIFSILVVLDIINLA